MADIPRGAICPAHTPNALGGPAWPPARHDGAELHFFLIEDDLNAIEALRKLVGSQRQTARFALDELRGKVDERDVPLVDSAARVFGGVHDLLVAALDARTAELTEGATGYKRPE